MIAAGLATPLVPMQSSVNCVCDFLFVSVMGSLFKCTYLLYKRRLKSLEAVRIN